MSKTSIAIVDNDELVLNLLGQFISQQPGFDLIFLAKNGAECLEKLEDLQSYPDVFLLDLKMAPLDGAETADAIRRVNSAVKIIIMSSHYKDSFTGFLLKSGVNAFVPKGLSPQKLLEIIAEVQERGYFFMQEQIEILRNQIKVQKPKELIEKTAQLTKRELEVLQLICQQHTAKEIGEKLFITPRTAEGHKNRLFSKTGTRNIAGLAVYAIKEGLISADQILLR